MVMRRQRKRKRRCIIRMRWRQQPIVLCNKWQREDTHTVHNYVKKLLDKKSSRSNPVSYSFFWAPGFQNQFLMGLAVDWPFGMGKLPSEAQMVPKWGPAGMGPGPNSPRPPQRCWPNQARFSKRQLPHIYDYFLRQISLIISSKPDSEPRSTLCI